MRDSVDLSGRPFHFIGIGGIGMSALAYVVAKRRLPVSGSDLRASHITQKLEALGTHIFQTQDASNLQFFQPVAKTASQPISAVAVGVSAASGVLAEPRNSVGAISTNTANVLPQVICSTAINPANSEYQAALDLGCPIFHRSDLLAALLQDYHSIAVAGTHGKTTTSSLVGYLLLKAGLDPTIVVGGEVSAWEGNARLGQSQYLVAEADESDGTLAKLSAQIGVITNIELDHTDHYESLEDVIDTFQVFAQSCQSLVACIDCIPVRDRFKPTLSYSLHPETGADYTVTDVEYHATGTKARVWERSKAMGVLNLRLLGQHNLSNALAAVAVGRLLGLEFSVIAQGLATFEGASRRFELRGEVNRILFIDDYAHHPSEVAATLAAARLQAQAEQRVVAIFQPHRYSRTLTFLDEFSQSFGNADVVVVTDIYSAGEPNLGQINGQKMAEAIAMHHPQVTYQPNFPAIQQFLTQNLRSGDIALFLGAGNLNQIIPEVINSISQISP